MVSKLSAMLRSAPFDAQVCVCEPHSTHSSDRSGTGSYSLTYLLTYLLTYSLTRRTGMEPDRGRGVQEVGGRRWEPEPERAVAVRERTPALQPTLSRRGRRGRRGRLCAQVVEFVRGSWELVS